jgi:hypothetical protein
MQLMNGVDESNPETGNRAESVITAHGALASGLIGECRVDPAPDVPQVCLASRQRLSRRFNQIKSALSIK